MKKNILIVMLDGCRAERLSLCGGSEHVTPHLEALRDRAFVMRRNYSTSYCTTPSYTSMMTGMYPVIHKACGTYSYYDGSYQTLPEIFSHAGYQSFLVFNNIQGFSPEIGMMNGFERFYRIGKRSDWFKETTEEKRGVVTPPLYKRILRRIMRELKEVSPEQHDKVFAAAVLDAYKKKDMGGAAAVDAFERFLRERDAERPFFGLVCLPDTHHPYIAPEPYMSKMGVADPSQGAVLFNFKANEYVAGLRSLDERDKADLSKMMDATVAYVDALAGRVVSLLKEQGLFDDTLIVFMSDHGGNIGERRNYLGSACFSYDVEARTVFALVNAGRSGVCDHLSSTVDIFPTLLHAAGLDAFAKACHGKNVLDPEYSGHGTVLFDYPMWPEWLQRLGFQSMQEIMLYVHVNRTLVTSDLKKLIWLSTGQHELYDLAADPAEHTNIFRWDDSESLALIDTMREKYREYVGSKAEYLEYYPCNDYGYAYRNANVAGAVRHSDVAMEIIDIE